MKTYMMTVVTQNVALLILVHSYEKLICQINNSFIPIRLSKISPWHQFNFVTKKYSFYIKSI